MIMMKRMAQIMKNNSLLITNCHVDGRLTNIAVENGIIKAVGENAVTNIADYETVIEAHEMCAAPGLVDMHVHLRDPGQTQKEDIISGCSAAAAGGFTSIACMPNTTPTADNEETIKYIIEKSKLTGVDVYPIASITQELSGEKLTNFKKLRDAGAIAFSDDGRPVVSSSVMLEAMKKAKRIKATVISHCEDLSFEKGLINEGKVSQTLKIKGIPNAVETCQVAREIALSLTSGLPIHIAHVSTAESVEMIRKAKIAGVKITCETCPHYFSLDESYLVTKDANYRMNPPLRTKRDIKAIIEGLRDGTIDAIATDHAPHTKDDKADFEKAPNGIIGLETALAVGITYLVRPGHLLLEELINKMTNNPTKILGIDAGTLGEGSKADIVIFDPEQEFIVDKEKMKSKSRNTPFDGMKLFGKVKFTVKDGTIIYKA